MKIQPVKNYKKPCYAAALASLLTATAMTGCGPEIESGVAAPVDSPAPETEVQLDGDVAVDVPSEESEDETPVMLDGDVIMETEESTCPETDLLLAGDIAFPTEDVAIPGWVTVEEDTTEVLN